MRSYKLVLLGLLLLVPLHAEADPGAKLKTYTWFRYTMGKENRQLKENQFAVKRGYLRWEYTFSDAIKSRVTVDLFSSDKDPHGAGLKLKDAYMDLDYLIPGGKIKVGLQKTYFGLIYDWDYLPIEKSLEDKQKLVASRDYGVSIGGYLPQGYGEWQLEVVNGEGYKHTGEQVNTKPAYVANLRLIPVPGITVGASILREQSGQSPYQKRLLIAAMGRIARGTIDTWLEYLHCEKGEVKSRGFMIMPIVNIRPKLGLIVRYDFWDKDTDKERDALARYIAGLNYYLVKETRGPRTMLQVFWEREDPEEGDTKDKYMVQLRWEFASKPF